MNKSKFITNLNKVTISIIGSVPSINPGSRMGWGTEAKGEVKPSNFNFTGNDLQLERDNAYHDWIGNGSSTIGSRSFSNPLLPTNDSGPPGAGNNRDVYLFNLKWCDASHPALLKKWIPAFAGNN